MNTTEFLEISSVVCPDRAAIIFEGKKYSFTELNQRAIQLADALSKLGAQKGDRIAILQVNCHQNIEAYFATAKLGGIFVPLNFRAKQNELSHMLSNAEASILFVGERYIDLVNSMRPNLSAVKHYICIGSKTEGMLDYEELLASGSPELKMFAEIDDGDVTVLMYTAGTTGLPKGVPLTHNSYSFYVLQNSYCELEVHLWVIL